MDNSQSKLSARSKSLMNTVDRKSTNGYTHLLVKKKQSQNTDISNLDITDGVSDQSVVDQSMGRQSVSGQQVGGNICSGLRKESICYKSVKGLDAGGGSTDIEVVDYICDTSHTQLVLKQIKTTDFSKLKSAIDIHMSLKQQNIIDMCFMFEENSKIYTVIEYIEGGNLYEFREEFLDTGKEMYPLIFFYILQEIAKGLEYIYNHNIIHRDIKPENIVVSQDISAVKIIDFDFAVVDNGSIKIDKGTMQYRPINENAGTITDKSYDMWSLGATMFYFGCGSDIKDVLYNIYKKPFLDEYKYADLPFTDKHIEKSIQRAFRDHIISDILMNMLTLNKSKRLTPVALVYRTRKIFNCIVENMTKEELIAYYNEMKFPFILDLINKK